MLLQGKKKRGREIMGLFMIYLITFLLNVSDLTKSIIKKEYNILTLLNIFTSVFSILFMFEFR